MSKKTTTDTTIKYDPMGMQGYHSSVGSLQDMLKDPMKSIYWLQQMQLAQRMISRTGARNANALMSNLAAAGMTNAPGGALMANLARIGRASSGMQADALLNIINQATNAKMGAAQLLQNPLRTGDKTVQKTSGVGTWLPQVLGGALSFAMPLVGGAMGLGGAGGGPSAMGSFSHPTFMAGVNPYIPPAPSSPYSWGT